MHYVTARALADELLKIARRVEPEEMPKGYGLGGALLGAIGGGTAGTAGGLVARRALLERGMAMYPALALPALGIAGGAALGHHLGKRHGEGKKEEEEALKRRHERQVRADNMAKGYEERRKRVEAFFKEHDQFRGPEYAGGGKMWQDPKFRARARALGIQEYD